MVRPMVHSTKHYVQVSIAQITAGAVLSTNLVKSVTVGAKNTPDEVEEGNSIKACYLEMWVRAAATTGSSGQLALYKVPGSGTNATAAEMAQIHDYDNKKNIIEFHQGLFNEQDVQAISVYRGWYKIPKSKQRFGLGDRLVLTIAPIAVDVHVCGFATYKEYS